MDPTLANHIQSFEAQLSSNFRISHGNMGEPYYEQLESLDHVVELNDSVQGDFNIARFLALYFIVSGTLLCFPQMFVV